METGQEWSIGRLLSTSSAYWKSSTVHAGVKLEIFTVIGDRQLTAGEISRKINGREHSVSMLLNGLTSLGLLEHSGDRYANTDFSRTYLIRGAKAYVGYIVMHHFHLVDAWAQLYEAVLQGAPVDKKSYGEAAERESFQMGMFNLAMAIAPSIAEAVDLNGRRRLLDLGGGPGTHAIHFCLKYPHLRATVFDRQTTEPFARMTAERFKVADRVEFIAGDFNADHFGGPYDAAWLSQILHSYPYEQCAALIKKTAAALEPGGVIMIHDFLLNDTMDSPSFPALFSLNMLLSNHGRSYAEKEVAEMLRQAGAVDIRRLGFQGPNDSAILCGTV